MTDTAKLFTNGRSQAVSLPMAYRFKGDEVFIRRDEQTGDVILSPRPTDWGGFFKALEDADFAVDFPSLEDRNQGVRPRGEVLRCA